MTKQPNTKKIMRWTGACAAALIVFTLFLLWFSPYKYKPGSNRKMIEYSVTINRPVNHVFGFIHNNEAAHWMTYVDHVKKIGKSPYWRYYCNADETGQRYDGTVVSMEKNKRVKVKLSNFVDFPFAINDVINEQEFIPVGENACTVKFKLYYDSTDQSMVDECKARLAAWRIQKVFAENLDNIKAEIEEPKYVKN